MFMRQTHIDFAVSTILTSKKRSDEAVDVSEMEDMMKKDEEVSVPVDSVPEAAAPECKIHITVFIFPSIFMFVHE